MRQLQLPQQQNNRTKTTIPFGKRLPSNEEEEGEEGEEGEEREEEKAVKCNAEKKTARENKPNEK